ncbi:MAG: toprim domain-containing protein, partial [Candidatus Hodarchaeota archaeon]
FLLKNQKKKKMIEEVTERIKSFGDEVIGRVDLVVCEGVKDAEAIKSLNWGVEIVTLEGKPLVRVADEISKEYKRVLILTDFDKKGQNLAKNISKFLLGRSKVDWGLRNKMKRILKPYLRIEEISSILGTSMIDF